MRMLARCAIAVGLMALFSITLQAQPSEASASATAEKFQERIVQVMRDGPQIGFAGRRERIRSILNETFDFPYLTRLVMGKHWKGLSKAQKKEFYTVFGLMAMSLMASQFTKLDDEQFVLLEEKPLKKRSRPRARVVSELRNTKRGTVKVNYALHKRDSEWRIVDIWFNGVSGSRIQREEVSAVMEKSGFDAVIKSLKARVKRFEAGESDASYGDKFN